MNEEQMQEIPGTAPGGEEDAARDPSPTEGVQESMEACDTGSNPGAEDGEAPRVSQNTGADPDPHIDPDIGETAPGALDELRRELNALREEIYAKEEKQARLSEEFAEFCALYPDVDLHTVSDTVWARVKTGVPLSCAYAAEERRQALIAEAAKQSNAANRARAGGSIKPAPRAYFSRDEVLAMSRQEVHKNFDHILRSMEKWS